MAESPIGSPRVWFYSVVDHDEGTRFSVKGRTMDGVTNVYIAEEICADHYYNHGLDEGWESTWPLTFILYESEKGPETGRFKVKLEWLPVFDATEVKNG
jgi:hypothetical protein